MIFKLNSIGSTHKQNEDTLLYLEKGEYQLLCVMDGCSGGKDSVFAAHLIKKVINREAKLVITDNLSLNECLSEILLRVFRHIGTQRLLLCLESNELESTIGICLIKGNEYSLAFAGDGVYNIDQEVISINQNNQPNYIGHYENSKNFMESLHYSSGKFFYKVGISTDGLERKLKRIKRGYDDNYPKLFNQDDVTAIIYENR